MSAVETIEAINASVEETRELVRVVEVDDVIKHPNADALELAIIGGWQCCVQLGEFKKGGLAIYCEIDALLPISNPNFSFLEARKDSLKLVGEETYSRIKTIRLRKELSQGLLVPVPADMVVKKGDNLTATWGVLKYEGKAESPGASAVYNDSWFGRMCSFIAGGELPKLQLPWPNFLKKSDQPRVQNVSASYNRAVEDGEEFEATFKLDGASMTAWLYHPPTVNADPDVAITVDKDDPNPSKTVELVLREFAVIRSVFGVGSRNNELIREDVIWSKTEQIRRWIATLLMMNRRMFKIRRFILPRWRTGLIASDDMYVATAIELSLEQRLRAYLRVYGKCLAIQGELCGPNIQSNFEGLSERTFFVYSVFVQEGSVFRELLPDEARDVTSTLALKYVPVLGKNTVLPPTVKDCLKYAEGNSAFKKGGYREGVVFKSTTRDFSFKAISNSYLLKQGD
ncbi:RNA ligase [compost metagenome]